MYRFFAYALDRFFAYAPEGGGSSGSEPASTSDAAPAVPPQAPHGVGVLSSDDLNARLSERPVSPEFRGKGGALDGLPPDEGEKDDTTDGPSEDDAQNRVSRFLTDDPFAPTDEGSRKREPSPLPDEGKKAELPKASEPPKTAEPSELEQLRRQFEQLQRQNTTLVEALTRAQPTASASQKPEDAQIQAAQEVNRVQSLYNFNNLPDDVVEGLASEDKSIRSTAISSLLRGVATAAHFTVMQEVTSRLGQLEQRVPELVSTNVSGREYQRQIRDDFYQAYPHLQNPGVKPIVQQTAKEVFTSTGAQYWSPEIRDMIAQRVTQRLQEMAQIVQPTQSAPPRASSRPGAMNGGVRPGVKSQQRSLTDEIMATFAS